jgi:tripartite-type tricarboxylate transporter receptor subunit TctC
MILAIRRHTHPAALAIALLTLVFVAPSGRNASSQTARTIKIIVPSPPGSANDILARVLAEQIGRTQGRAMVVEDRPGAGQIIATEIVSRAAPDGSTVLFTANPFVINPHLRKLNYDPLNSFEPICDLVSLPTVIVVNVASPYRTLADLIDAARASPGELTLASVGPGTASQIAFEMLKRAAKVNMTFVPYPGTPPAITALLGGHVTAVFAGYADAHEQLSAGKLRALAAASRTRIDSMPTLPTVAESGYEDYEADLWYGLVAPAKTPKEIISRLADWFTTAMLAPNVKSKLAALALYPVAICGADFGAFLRKQYEDYGRVIREANIKAE